MSHNYNCKNKKEGDITLHYIDILAVKMERQIWPDLKDK